jgi:phage-related holin
MWELITTKVLTVKNVIASILGVVFVAINPSIEFLLAWVVAASFDFVVGFIHSWFFLNMKFSVNKFGLFWGRLLMTFTSFGVAYFMKPIWDTFPVIDILTVPHLILSVSTLLHFISMLENFGRMGLPFSHIIIKFIETRSQIELKEIKEKKDEIK